MAEIQTVTKSLDGVSTLSIGTTVKEKLTIRLFDTTNQVHILVNDLSIFESTEDSSGSFTSGQYVTLELEVPKDIVPLTFTPDEYLPAGSSINWEWSNSRILWNPLEQDEMGKYLPLTWNLVKPDTEPVGNEDPYAFSEYSVQYAPTLDGTSLTNIASISADHTGFMPNPDSGDILGEQYTISNIVTKAGVGCLLFVTKEMQGYNAFLGYLDVPDETGYRLDLPNPDVPGVGKLISNIILNSDDVSINSPTSSDSITYDLPMGIHKFELHLNGSLDFSSYDFQTKTILQVLLDDFLVDFNIDLSADTLGRTINYGVQLQGLTEIDLHKLSFMNEIDQIQKFSVVEHRGYDPTPGNYDHIDYRIVTRQMNPGLLYDIFALDSDLYGTTSTEHIGHELHFYAGDGTANWEVDMYHTPNADVTWNETGNTYTPVGKTITIANADLSTTSTSHRELATFSGDDVEATLDLGFSPIASVSLLRDNIHTYQDIDLNSTLEEDFPSFSPKGRTKTSISLTLNDDEQTFSGLAYYPQVGYCSIDNWEGLIKYSTRSAMQAACLQEGGTWFSGYCKGDPVTNENECLCGANGTWDGTECTAGELTSNTWNEYVQAQDVSGANIYPIVDVNIDNKEVTVSGLTGQAGLELEIYYDFGDMQSSSLVFYHEQEHTLLTAGDDTILLERTPKATEVVWVYLPNSNHKSQDLTPTFDSNLNAWILDLTGITHPAGSFTIGDTITLVYKCETSLSTEESVLTLSNLPKATKTRKIYEEIGTSSEPTASTNIVLENVPASREIGGTYADPNGNLYIEINGQSGFCVDAETTSGIVDDPQPATETLCLGGDVAGTWTDYQVVNSISGNVVEMDLTDWAAAEGDIQNPVYIFMRYESYEHTESYKFLLQYDYYKNVPYTFNYQYDDFRLKTVDEIYQTESDRAKFYDISYYKIAGDDLYMKAELSSSGNESPIIRRLKFER